MFELFFYHANAFMGTFQKESLKYIIVSYFGYFIGIFSTIFLYASDLEFYGTLRYILAISLLLSSFFSLGLNASVVKFYYELKDKNITNNFMTFSIIGILSISLIGYLFFILVKNIFINPT